MKNCCILRPSSWLYNTKIFYQSQLAEAVGFEPTDPRGSTVFKTAALNHSATLPKCPRVVRMLSLSVLGSYYQDGILIRIRTGTSKSMTGVLSFYTILAKHCCKEPAGHLLCFFRRCYRLTSWSRR